MEKILSPETDAMKCTPPHTYIQICCDNNMKTHGHLLKVSGNALLYENLALRYLMLQASWLTWTSLCLNKAPNHQMPSPL